MKKIFLSIILILCLSLVFALSISAKGNFNGFFNDTSVDYSDYKLGSSVSDFGLVYYNFFSVYGVTNNIRIARQVVIDMNVNAIINALDTNDFYSSSLDAVDFLGLNPVNNLYLRTLYNNSAIYTNIDNVTLCVNILGDYIHSIHNKKVEILGLQADITDLNGRISSLNTYITELEQANADNEELIATFERENALLFENLTNTQLELQAKKEEYNELQTRFEEFQENAEDNYIKGFNDGLSESNVFIASVKEVANTPFTFFKTILDFELFGVNFFALLKFVLSILIIGFAVKLFL